MAPEKSGFPKRPMFFPSIFQGLYKRSFLGKAYHLCSQERSPLNSRPRRWLLQHLHLCLVSKVVRLGIVKRLESGRVVKQGGLEVLQRWDLMNIYTLGVLDRLKNSGYGKQVKLSERLFFEHICLSLLAFLALNLIQDSFSPSCTVVLNTHYITPYRSKLTWIEILPTFMFSETKCRQIDDVNRHL